MMRPRSSWAVRTTKIERRLRKQNCGRLILAKPQVFPVGPKSTRISRRRSPLSKGDFVEMIVMRITPDARAIEIDYTEAPDAYHVCTLNADGGFLELLESFTGIGNAEKALELADRPSRETGLPLKR